MGHVDASCNQRPDDLEGMEHNVTDVEPPFPEGAVASYLCSLLHERFGGSSYSRCSEGAWSNVTLECVIKQCPLIYTPRNGHVVGARNYTVTARMEFGCNSGYDLQGSSSLLCRVDAEWYPEVVPTCEPRNCGEIPAIDNADGVPFQDTTVAQRNKYGSVAKVTCKDGFILNGSPTVTCQASGEWSAIPTCTAITCPAYPGLNSSCVDNVLRYETFLYFTCKSNEDVTSTRFGPDSATCRADGSWDDTSMTCFCNCKIELPNSVADLVLIQNADNGFLSHGANLQYQCARGLIRTSDELQCLDGQFFLQGRVVDTSTITTDIVNRLCSVVTTTLSSTGQQSGMACLLRPTSVLALVLARHVL